MIMVACIIKFPLNFFKILHIFIGVCNRWMDFITNSSTECCPIAAVKLKLKPDKVKELNAVYSSFKDNFPTEFGRSPRSLTCGSWKATEYRQFILYAGIALLIGRVDCVFVKNMLFLHCALRILSDPIKVQNEDALNRAEWFVQKFVETSISIFGPGFCVFNVHSLLHLVADVRMHKSTLDRFSAFFAENSYRKLMKSVTGPFRPLQQVVKRILQKMAFEEGRYRQGAKQKNHRPLYQFAQQRVLEVVGETGYAVCQTRNFFYHCENKRDCFSEVAVNGNIVYIECDHFVVVHVGGSEQQFVVGRQMIIDNEQELYDYPMKASHLGIRIISGVEANVQQRWPMSSLRRKLYKLPLSSHFNNPGPRDVVIPLLHGMTTD
jgi:hypothetical protein